MRIVSLVPSLTKTLFDFNLDSNTIVGRTKFCIHPHDEVKLVPIVGGTKDLKIEKIRNLQPDLILASKEENEKLQVLELMAEFDVWVTDIQNLDDNAMFLSELGKRLNKPELAQQFNARIETMFLNLKKAKPQEVTYLIWKDPYLSVGRDTFINSVLTEIGLKNSQEAKKRYPELSLKELGEQHTILLSSEPFPFKTHHKEALLARYPNLSIVLVDGEAFSWYGTHILEFETYFQNLCSTL